MKKINNYLQLIINLIKNNRKSAIILAGLLAIGIGLTYYIAFYKFVDLGSEVVGQKVEFITIDESILVLSGKIETTGEVQSVNQAEIKAEYSAPVSGIYAGIGDTVRAGQVLVTLRNADLSAGVAQAKANLQRELSRLDDLKQSLTGGVSSYEELVKQQDILVANSYRSLLSDDLEAVPKSAYGSGEAPTIIGSYNSNVEGDYIIDMYASGANSGYSFRVSGLEKGVGTVKTESSVPLGARGLYIQWPENLSGNETWIVSVPNKRSSTYVSRLNVYEANKSARSLNSAQSNSNLKAQEAIVAQARASLSQTEAQASKTVFRAPVSGSVLTLPVKLGEYVSPGQLIALVANRGNIQVKSYISSGDIENVAIGNKVVVAEKYQGLVSRVSPGIDPMTQKIEVLVEVTDKNINKLVIGEFVKVQIEVSSLTAKTEEDNNKNSIFLPLRSVKLDPNQAYVFMIDPDSRVISQVVVVGELKGDKVEIISGIKNGDKVISSVRGLSIGDLVSVDLK